MESNQEIYGYEHCRNCGAFEVHAWEFGLCLRCQSFDAWDLLHGTARVPDFIQDDELDSFWRETKIAFHEAKRLQAKYMYRPSRWEMR